MRSVVQRMVDIDQARLFLDAGSAELSHYANLPCGTGHYPADRDGGWSLLLAEGCKQRRFILTRHSQQESTRGLRIHAKVAVGRIEVRRPLHPFERFEIPLGT